MHQKWIVLLTFTTLCVFGFGGLSAAPDQEKTDPEKPVAAPDDFQKTIRDYLRAKFKGEAAVFYGDKVVLMPGHEYLKAEYGISPEGDRSKAFEATREQVIKVDHSDALTVSPDRVEAILEAMDITAIRVENDEGYVIEGSDGEGEMTMPSKAGDVVAVARIKGKEDFLAFLLRRIDGEWKVAAEYLD